MSRPTLYRPDIRKHDQLALKLHGSVTIAFPGKNQQPRFKTFVLFFDQLATLSCWSVCKYGIYMSSSTWANNHLPGAGGQARAHLIDAFIIMVRFCAFCTGKYHLHAFMLCEYLRNCMVVKAWDIYCNIKSLPLFHELTEF